MTCWSAVRAISHTLSPHSWPISSYTPKMTDIKERFVPTVSGTQLGSPPARRKCGATSLWQIGKTSLPQLIVLSTDYLVSNERSKMLTPKRFRVFLNRQNFSETNGQSTHKGIHRNRGLRLSSFQV